MAIITSEAFLLRKIPFKNSSYIVHMFTQELGRLSLVAKGARREKSSFFGCIDYLSELNIVCIPKSGIGILTECSVRRYFRNIHSQSGRISYGCMFFRIVREFLEERDPCANIYSLCRSFTESLDGLAAEKVYPCYLFMLYRLIRLAGYRPEVTRCSRCGSSVTEGVFFSSEDEGIICRSCEKQKKEKKNLELSEKSLTIIKAMDRARHVNDIIQVSTGTALPRVETFILAYASSIFHKDLTFITAGTYNVSH